MKATFVMLAFMGAYGCAGMSYDELEHKSMTCDPKLEEDCRKWQAQFERRYEKQQNEIKCPDGMIVLKQRGRAQCMNRYGFEKFISPWE